MSGAPAEWAGSLWAVAFNHAGLRTETRLNPDGAFQFRQLPPGEYGLKVGHDAFMENDQVMNR